MTILNATGYNGPYVSVFARTILDDADAAAVRSTLGISLPPFVDETAIVYETGVPANTLTFDVSAFTAARVVTWPDAAMTVAGLEVPNVFTAIQKINVNSALALLVEQDGVKDNTLVVDTANGRVGVGVAPSAPLHLVGTSGELRLQSTVADASNKLSRMSVAHYTNTEEPLFIFGATTFISSNVVLFGGGSSSGNAATQVSFYSAANNTTTTGTEVARVTIAGMRIEPTGIATNPTVPLNVVIRDAITNDITDMLAISHNTTGTAADNIGSGLVFQAASSTQLDRQTGRLLYKWLVATNATRAAQGNLTANYVNTERTCISWGANSTAPLFGVLGATPVVRQLHIADPAGGLTVDAEARTAINAILVVLENFGFVATS